MSGPASTRPLRRTLSGLAGAAALIALITIAARVVGFGRWLAQSASVGANATGTAYGTANLLPNVLFEVVAGGALAGAIVPLLAGPLAKNLRGDVDRISSALLTWALAVLLPMSVLLALLARPLVALLIPAARPDADPAVTQATVDLAGQLLVVFAPQIVLYGIGVVLTGILQAQRRFVWPAAAPLASSAVVIASYLVFHSIAGGSVNDPAALTPEAVAWLAWGTTAGVAAMSLPLLIPVLHSGVTLRPTFAFPSGVGVRARRLALAGVGGLLAQQAAVLVTVKLANSRGELGGTLNIFQYSQAVYFLPYAVLAVPLATAAFPRLAEHAATGDLKRYARLVATSTRAVLLVSAAGAASLAAAAPAVTFVFSAVDASNDTAALAAMEPTLVWLAPGLLGYALIFQLSRVLFALERGRAAVLAVVTGWLAVVVASVVAVLALTADGPSGADALRGLAIGNTIGMTVAGVVLLVAVRRSAGPAALAGVPRTLLVAGASAALGALGGRWVVDSVLDLTGSNAASAIVSALGGAALSVLVVVAATWFADRTTILGALAADRPGTRGQTGPGARRG
ncbi:murein biosynthesis integral membrane protein MurJ [Pengzhenrongella sicca]|uniref:Virulence factor MviN n=1 Tax=Pengzhenrongella sicca TaxID=2819238 RepID=A0A8A4ZJN5_9MICO|nr:lipid II flippase MurJ [Pengzhenrongella sicca]QTE30716.1 virulence factor MviN [Pengzhenrongella sicca]